MTSLPNHKSNLRFWMFAAATGVLLGLVQSAPAQQRAPDPSRFDKAITAFEAADQANPPPKNPVLFVGASNVRRWTSLSDRFRSQAVLNRGFGGAHLSDVVHYANRIVIPYAPQKIYLNAGGNDLHAGKEPAEVAAAFRAFVHQVRSAVPEVKLAYISIPPSPARWAETENIKEANRLIADYAADDGQIEFIDIFPLLLDGRGEPRPEYYVEDGLHFSERGYDVVTTAIKWQRAVQNFAAADINQPPPHSPILFIGSSSIVRWSTLAADFSHLPVLNRGFGGSEIFDSVVYAHRLVLPYRPRMVVMYAGGNDINAGKTPERVAADFREFVQRVHGSLPETRIAYISIAPNPARWRQVERVKEANQLIASFTKTDKRLLFIDVFPHMLADDGLPKPDLFVEDRLHMNANGYALWKDIVGPYLEPDRESPRE